MLHKDMWRRRRFLKIKKHRIMLARVVGFGKSPNEQESTQHYNWEETFKGYLAEEFTSHNQNIFRLA